MTLAVGDKVKTPRGEGTVVAVRHPASYYDVDIPGKSGPSSVTPGASTYHVDRLEKIEEPADADPLGLQAGDKVVNLKTGREGLVLKGPVSGVLKVYDQKPPIKDAVPAAALEEYEFWHPGTYDVWRLSEKLKPKAQPW